MLQQKVPNQIFQENRLGNANAHGTIFQSCPRPGRIHRGGQKIQCFNGSRQKGFSIHGQENMIALSLKQRESNILLQGRNGAAQCRLGHMENVRRPRKAFILCDCLEVVQLHNFHVRSSQGHS